MKTGTVITLLLLLVFCSPLSAREPGPPHQVDVFPQGALLTWIIPAQPEMTLLLPSTFLPDRIRYQTREHAVVKQMEVVSQGTKDWLPEGLAPLIQEMEVQRQEMKLSQAQLAGILQTINYLQGYSPTGNGEDALGFILRSQQLRIESEKERQRLVEEIQEAEVRLQELEESLRRLYAGDVNRLVRLNLETNGTGYLEITAFTPYASWFPFYRAQLDSNEQSMILTSLVSVAQKTGIPWEGTISFHTSAPHDRVTIPSLQPLVVRIAEETLAPIPQQRMVLEDTKSQWVGMEPLPDLVRFEGEAGLIFHGQGQVNTDGEPVLLRVAEEILPVEIRPTLIPYQEKEAYIMVETHQPVQSLLQGEVELVVDGSFTGGSTLQHTGAGESLKMAFGRSPLITAQRDGVVYQERRTWLGKRILQDGYQIEVMNGTSKAVELVIMDRVPLAGDERITIRLSMDPEPIEQKQGVLLWRLSLEAHQQMVITVEYQIEYPDGMRLIYR